MCLVGVPVAPGRLAGWGVVGGTVPDQWGVEKRAQTRVVRLEEEGPVPGKRVARRDDEGVHTEWFRGLRQTQVRPVVVPGVGHLGRGPVRLAEPDPGEVVVRPVGT